MLRNHLIILLLILATIVVYWHAKENTFVDADDPLYITENVHVRGGLDIDNALWAFTTDYAANWHPLIWLSHMLDCSLFGLNPAWHHLMNVFFHITNSILLFLVLVQMTRKPWQSAFVTAVFALHPLHVESVAWAAERKDVLSTLFWMLTVAAYSRYVRKKARKSYVLVLLFFALGLMAKPMLVTLPFVLLLLDYWPFRRFEIDQVGGGQPGFNKLGTLNRLPHKSIALRLFQEKIPLLALAIASSIITLVVQQHGGAIPTSRLLPLETRISNAFVAYVKYIGKAIWPTELAVFYPYQIVSLPLWQSGGAALLLIVVSVLVVRYRKTFPYLTVGWFWFLGTLVPVIGLVQVGGQAMADRYMYVPLIGPSIIIAWGSADFFGRRRYGRTALVTLAAAAISAMTMLTWIQVGYWRDTITLFEHANEVTKNNYVALTSLGAALQKQGNIDGALDRYRKALRINSSYELAHYNLAVALQSKREIDEAIAHFSEAVRLDPGSAANHYGLATALSDKGETQKALMHFQQALEIEPEYWAAHYAAALLLGRVGNLDGAIFHFAEAVRIKPDNPDAQYNLGLAFHRKGVLENAILHYSQAIRLQPDNAYAHGNLGAALHKLGRIDEAITQYKQALQLKPDYIDARNNLDLAIAVQRQMTKP
jgi:tetratricopeptide (TPR) repeat protein